MAALVRRQNIGTCLSTAGTVRNGDPAVWPQARAEATVQNDQCDLTRKRPSTPLLGSATDD